MTLLIITLAALCVWLMTLPQNTLRQIGLNSCHGFPAETQAITIAIPQQRSSHRRQRAVDAQRWQ
jgi:hypothetical protein